jgi:hypothetical protein
MASSDKYHCRVCGFWDVEMPWGEDGKTPSFEYCPCCGVQHGYQDTTAKGACRFRSEWIAGGGVWSVPKVKPNGWNLTEQLEFIPIRFRAMSHKG